MRGLKALVFIGRHTSRMQSSSSGEENPCRRAVREIEAEKQEYTMGGWEVGLLIVECGAKKAPFIGSAGMLPRHITGTGEQNE